MSKKKKKKKKLIPPDGERCQAEKTVDTNFMTLGGPPVGSMERCRNKPTTLATEKEPGPDGQRGSMTVCDACLAVMREQVDAEIVYTAIA